MQPLKITLYGNYYDCQIYRGRLYLWTFDGDLCVYDWNRLVDSFIVDGVDALPLRYGFQDGRYLYRQSIQQIFEDIEFKELLSKKYIKASKIKHIVSENDVAYCLIGKQDSPSGRLPLDTEIYNSNLYYSNDEGFYRTTAHRPIYAKYMVSTKPIKVWDGKALSIVANDYPQMALSAGSDGLLEYSLSNSVKSLSLKIVEPNLYKVSDKFSLYSNYIYESIFSSSRQGGSYISQFKFEKYKDKYFGKEKSYRNYDREIEEREFDGYEESKDGTICWGVQDKIYMATSQKVKVMKYNKWNAEGGDRMHTIETKNNKHDSMIIKGGAAIFGNIIEYEDGLLVMRSDGKKTWIPGEITRWRVYPRSLNYLNHLHVILDDRIEFYSFNHDYFIDQSQKVMGTEYIEPRPRGSNVVQDIGYFDLMPY